MDRYRILKKKLSNNNTGEMPDNCFFSIKDICDYTKPTSILEIGFNRGNSALMWLLNSEAKLTSIDVRKEVEIKKSLDTLKSNFPSRFEYHKIDAYKQLPFKSEWVGKFDLIFIDCWHVPVGYELDSNTAMYFGSPYIAYDDYLTHTHSSFIKKFVKDHKNLEEIKTYPTGAGQSIVKNLNYTETKGDEIFLENNKKIISNNLKKLAILEKGYRY